MEDKFTEQNFNNQWDHDEIMKSATILDEGIEEPSQSAPLTHAEIIKNATIIDEGIKLCPVCRNEVRLFFINFNEKVLMCENVDCDFPFGHEDIIYVKENDCNQIDEEVCSIISRPTAGSRTYRSYSKAPSPTCSVVSTAAWLDIDKMNNINDNFHDHRVEQREYYKHKKGLKDNIPKNLEENQKLMKKIEAINKINEEIKSNNDRCIKNEKWIKNLLSKQQTSGLSLLKPEEISLFKQKKPEFGLGELKIDINREHESNSNTSAIKIQICNLNTDVS